MKKFIKITLVLVLCVAAIFAMRGDFTRLLKQIFPFSYKMEISFAAAEFNLDPYLVAAVIKVESSFNSNASSGVAHGLMQITNDTASFISDKTGIPYSKRLEPITNIRMGCYYLSYLWEKFQSLDTALAAYNAGPATVSGWLSNPKYSKDGLVLLDIPYSETGKYLNRIKWYYRIYKHLYS